jgi:hypothetical protein
MPRLGSGRPGRQIFREASLLQAGGQGGRRLIQRASLPCLTIGKYFLSFFHLCFVHPQPQSPTPAQFSLPSTLNLHQKERPVSFLVAILTFYNPPLYCRIIFL